MAVSRYLSELKQAENDGQQENIPPNQKAGFLVKFGEFPAAPNEKQQQPFFGHILSSNNNGSCSSGSITGTIRTPSHDVRTVDRSVTSISHLDKPSISYVSAVYDVLKNCPSGEMQPYEIYSALEEKYEYYRYLSEDEKRSWKSSVRHALLNPKFKSRKRGNEFSIHRKGKVWSINEAINEVVESQEAADLATLLQSTDTALSPVVKRKRKSPQPPAIGFGFVDGKMLPLSLGKNIRKPNELKEETAKSTPAKSEEPPRSLEELLQVRNNPSLSPSDEVNLDNFKDSDLHSISSSTDTCSSPDHSFFLDSELEEVVVSLEKNEEEMVRSLASPPTSSPLPLPLLGFPPALVQPQPQVGWLTLKETCVPGSGLGSFPPTTGPWSSSGNTPGNLTCPTATTVTTQCRNPYYLCPTQSTMFPNCIQSISSCLPPSKIPNSLPDIFFDDDSSDSTITASSGSSGSSLGLGNRIEWNEWTYLQQKNLYGILGDESLYDL